MNTESPLADPLEQLRALSRGDPVECYACGKVMVGKPSIRAAFLEDDEHRPVPVGSDCYRRIKDAWENGYTSPRGGPRLFLKVEFAAAYAKRTPA